MPGVRVPVPNPPQKLASTRPFPYERLSDAQLVASAARGDVRAWETIWRRHAQAVRGVLRACLGTDAALDDLVQEAFVGLYRAIGRLERPEALRAYLVSSAARLAAQEIRGRTRRFRWLRLTASGELPELATRPSALEDRDALRALQGVLDELGSELRIAFVLRYVEDLAPPDVARVLGVSESTAKRLCARARDLVLTLADRRPALRDFSRAAREREG